MKLLLLIWELNPKRVAEKMSRFLDGQKLKRKWKDEVAAVEREKPNYKPLDFYNH